ncbi:hypothetical protein [Methanoplanus endosymbiosus]|uniref:Lipoprotein n=1 Tax=Methanoplanus endosymbiosus TaxID=33865 RepID=A0A9E7TKJ9_9EURY|nr:hypothetical protein [Methanoplanus endosymbiosus]UUX92804.1 hypothetical protein L6E24_01360 [Methanoplanus endosymbiosus]
MSIKYIFPALLLIIVFLLSAGCSDSSQISPDGTGTNSAATVASSSGVPEGFSLNPLPVETVPDNLQVHAGAVKDPITGEITVTSNGGAGQYMVDYLKVTAYLSNGEIIEKQISGDVNSELIIEEGTKGDDRILVEAYYVNGKNYRIYDELLKYRERTDNK